MHVCNASLCMRALCQFKVGIDCWIRQTTKHVNRPGLPFEPELLEHRIRPRWFHMLQSPRQEQKDGSHLEVKTAVQGD